MEWLNSNADITIEAQQEQSDYYSYRTDDDKTVRTNAFKKIICHNLYRGVDVEYFFPEKGEGIRYDLIIHPGADLSKLKMNYSGFQALKQDEIGDIALSMADASTNDIIDSVPHTFYSDTHELLASSFVKTGNTISFAISNYDKTREIIIDPWMVDPGFTTDDVAFDIAKDIAGNIYVYGGGGSGNPWELKKFTSLGTLVWTYVTSFTGSSWYGDLAVDPAGNSFISEGCCDGIIEKINTNDSVLWTVTNGVYEYWLLTFDCSFTNLYLGCAYTSGAVPAESVSHLDVNTGAITGAVALNTSGSEPRDIAWAPNGNLYFLSCYGNDHVLAVTPAFTNIFSIPSGYSLPYNGPFYANGGNPTSAANGIAAGKSFLCTSDGVTLIKRDLLTGALMASIVIPGGLSEENSGVFIDGCNNIYAGSQNAVYQYDSLLNPITNVATTGAVYCLYPAGNGQLLACGNGFIASMAFPSSSSYSINKTITPASCGNCNGTASATLILCGNTDTSDVSYSWSNGQTTQKITGLCSGNYTVSISVSCSPVSFSDSVTILPSLNGNLQATKYSASANCNSNGAASITVTGGVSPYTYSWSNGATIDSIFGLAPGNYCVTVTDSAGCFDTVCFIIPGGVPPIIKITPPSDSLCIGSSVRLNATGASTYTWLPALGLSCTSCPNPNAGPLATKTYTVTGTDSVGCTSKDSITITLFLIPTITATPPIDSICAGASVTITANGASVYSWNPASSLSCNNCPNPVANPTVTTIYTVVGTSAEGCKDSTVAPIIVNPPPTVTITSPKSICPGDSVTLTATGGGTYHWSTGSNNSSISVSPSSTTSYFVTVTNGCSATATTKVNVVFPQLFLCCDTTIQTGNNTILYATSSGSYKWIPSTGLNCDTCSQVVASPTVTTTYTVIGTDSAGCQVERLVTVIVENLCNNYTVPNVFTPNEDGVNDVFEIKIQDVSTFSVVIYDRWGKKMYTSTNPANYWDGKTESGNKAPDGVYYYIIKSTCTDGESFTKNGYIQLIR